MCTRGSIQGLAPGPSTSPCDGMVSVVSPHQLRRRDAAVLCIAWATVLWAGFSIYLFTHGARVPGAIDLLVVLSGVICVIGGFLGILFLIAAARTWQTVLLGACATMCNLGYVWWYAYSIAHQ